MTPESWFEFAAVLHDLAWSASLNTGYGLRATALWLNVDERLKDEEEGEFSQHLVKLGCCFKLRAPRIVKQIWSELSVCRRKKKKNVFIMRYGKNPERFQP